VSIKYFCDSCDKEMSLDQSPPQVDGGTGWSAFMHDQGIETAWYDKLTDERTYDHQCKSCHIKEQGEESYYGETDEN